MFEYIASSTMSFLVENQTNKVLVALFTKMQLSTLELTIFSP